MGSKLTEPSVDRFVAKGAIMDVLTRYAYLAKENADFEAMVPLFTAGGTFTLPNGVAVSSREIASIVATGQPNFIRHHLTTVSVEFTDDDAAATDSYFIAYTDIAQPDHWGRWEDSFARQADGSWLLTNKSVIIEGWAPVSFWAQLMAKLGE